VRWVMVLRSSVGGERVAVQAGAEVQLLDTVGVQRLFRGVGEGGQRDAVVEGFQYGVHARVRDER